MLRGSQDDGTAEDSEYEVIVVDENNSSVLADHDSSAPPSIKVTSYNIILCIASLKCGIWINFLNDIFWNLILLSSLLWVVIHLTYFLLWYFAFVIISPEKFNNSEILNFILKYIAILTTMNTETKNIKTNLKSYFYTCMH